MTGCKLDIDERKTEIEYRDAEGKRQSFTPCRYAYSFDFYIVINVNNPYFNEIRFQLNDSAVDNDAETSLDGPDAVRLMRRHPARYGRQSTCGWRYEDRCTLSPTQKKYAPA